MMSPRWKKLLSDVRVARGRFIGIAIAMAITIAAVAAVLTAHVILERELNRNYLDTHPATAILTLDAVDDQLLAAVRKQPGVLAAERDANFTVTTQLPPVTKGQSIAVLLRVLPDFANLSISKFYPQSGSWPPALNEVLIERSVERMMPIELGSTLPIELPSGEQRSLRIAGSVHDPGNAPAWQERVVYGYITAATLAELDGTQSINVLNVRLDLHDVPSIEAATRNLALWLRTQGHGVHHIRIPPPGEHHHQWQIDSVLSLLLSFGVFGIVLEAALLAIVIGGLLNPQIKQIAVMKALGARTLQIVGMYWTLIAALTLIALSVGMPLGLYAGRLCADLIADTLNFNLTSYAVPTALYAICIALGVLMPLAVTLMPIYSVARNSVRESIDSFGDNFGDQFGVNSNSNSSGLRSLVSRIKVNNVSVQLALRSFSRRKSQLFFALTLLTLTGAVFVASGNVLRLWQIVTAQAIEEMPYDIEVHLQKQRPEAHVLDVIRSAPGVLSAESSITRYANLDEGDGLSFSTKRLRLRSASIASLSPTESNSVRMIAGRWLQADDGNAVVLNSAASAGVFAHVKVGDTISVLVDKHTLSLQVVGIARDMFSSAAGYTTANVLENIGAVPGEKPGNKTKETNYARVIIDKGADADVVATAIKQALQAAELPTRAVTTKETATAGITAHTYILIALLSLIVTAVAKVATAGLASCMSTNVIQRTVDFGVMRTLGARGHHIQNSIVIEALLIGCVSWVFAVALGIPLTVLINQLLVSSIDRPLPLVISPWVALLWLLGVALVATVASMAPARRAAALTIRQTLSHV